MKARLVNCVPLSVMILLGIPKWQTIDLKNLIADWAVTFLTGSTSGHFVNLSMAMNKYQSPRRLGGRGRGYRAPRPRRARTKGSSGELELAGVSSWNGTGTLHTWLLVQLHPGGPWARRNLAGTLCRQVLWRQCGVHICLRVSPPTAPVRLPGECTSISPHCVLFCTVRRRRTGTYWTAGLLFPLLLVLREVLLSGGNGRSAVPTSEPVARRRGLMACRRLREHQLLRQGLGAQPELDVPRQACRGMACRERLLRRDKPWGLPERAAPQHSWRRSWGLSWRRLREALPGDSHQRPIFSSCLAQSMVSRMAESA